MGFRDDLLLGIRTGACGIMNQAGTAARWGAGAGFAKSGPANTVVSLNLLQTASTAAGIFCNSPPLVPGDPSFVGGQCETDYRVTFTVDRYSDGEFVREQTRDGSQILRGPIQQVFIGEDSRRVLAIDRRAPSEILISGAVFGGITYQNLQNVTFERVDGLPDDCGDGESNPPPLTPEERTTDINIGDISGQLAIGNGVVQVNGDVTAPIRVNSPDFEITGELVLNKNEINLNFGGVDPTAPCEKPEVDTPEEPPPPEEPEEPEDGDSDIVGAIVRVSNIASMAGLTQRFQEGDPDYYTPALGYIAFKLRIGSSLAWTVEVPVKKLNQFVPNPTEYPAVAVAGTPWGGVTWSITPVREVAKEQQND